MNRSKVTAGLALAAVLAVVGWSAWQFLGLPAWLVAFVAACLVAAVVIAPGSDATDDADLTEWDDE